MLIRIESTVGFRTHARNPTTNNTAIKSHERRTEETEFLKELNKHNKKPHANRHKQTQSKQKIKRDL